mmetsp:Transcript_23582/g.54853  ORF Transcript_23582/g.54853 Transcript_23582/m.54853 type:complete len:122 (+) Transcript_23582:27-392(+)
MQFCTDQSGKYLAKINGKKSFRILGIDFEKFTQYSFPEISFLKTSNKIFVKSWNQKKNKKSKKGFGEEKYLVFFFLSLKNSILILDSRKKKGIKIEIKKSESFCNFENMAFFFFCILLFFF